MPQTRASDGRPVALITGCSSGIGRATARHLTARGWVVVATARSLERVADLQADETTEGLVAPMELDVTQEDSMVATVEATLARTRRLDALVNNVGYSEIGPLEDATAEEIRLQFETNSFGPLGLTQLVLPVMREQGAGRIVNISSIGGRVAIPFLGLYNASKFCLEAWSDALRVVARQFGTRVIVVEPGSVRTNFNSTAGEHSRRFESGVRSAYSGPYEGFERFVSRSTSSGSSPENVARVIHRALTAKNPRARYPATPQAHMMLAVVSLLSDRVRDATWRRLMKLSRSAT